ncbi:DgyrCDS9954 [Dimorphilus gyrociliatus]|uniref:DgyrCDS9954 n=1 Tax=Dimorphilus gyrociliatus TaxID=2664684 RepID=A0A7I8VYN3_9ANNE|nr:DgyrCDS9954 [Dimorphilus gyrociliatus]
MSAIKKPDVSFFEFPKKEKYPDLHKQWIALSERNNPLDLEVHRLCSKHFNDSDLKVTLDSNNHKRYELIDETKALPSKFPGRDNQKQNEALETISCVICGSTDKRAENFIRFPENSPIKELWTEICFGEEKRINKSSLVVCVEHFCTNSLQFDGNGKYSLKEGSVPIIHSASSTDVKSEPENDITEEEKNTDGENQNSVEPMPSETMIGDETSEEDYGISVRVERNIPSDCAYNLPKVSFKLDKIDEVLRIKPDDTGYFSINIKDLPGSLIGKQTVRKRTGQYETSEVKDLSSQRGRRYLEGICLMKGCSNRVSNAIKTGVRFFPFPKTEIMARKWAECTGRKNMLKVSTDILQRKVICSEHFADEDFRNPRSTFTSQLKKTAIPQEISDTEDREDDDDDDDDSSLWLEDTNDDFLYEWKPRKKRRRFADSIKPLKSTRQTSVLKVKLERITKKYSSAATRKSMETGERTGKIATLSTSTQTPNTIVVNKTTNKGSRPMEAPLGTLQLIDNKALKVRLPEFWKPSRVYATEPVPNINNRKLYIPKLCYDGMKTDVKRIVLSLGKHEDGLGITLPGAWKALDAFVLAPEAKKGKHKLVIPCEVPKRSKMNKNQTSIIIKTSGNFRQSVSSSATANNTPPKPSSTQARDAFIMGNEKVDDSVLKEVSNEYTTSETTDSTDILENVLNSMEGVKNYRFTDNLEPTITCFPLRLFSKSPASPSTEDAFVLTREEKIAFAKLLKKVRSNQVQDEQSTNVVMALTNEQISQVSELLRATHELSDNIAKTPLGFMIDTGMHKLTIVPAESSEQNCDIVEAAMQVADI